MLPEIASYQFPTTSRAEPRINSPLVSNLTDKRVRRTSAWVYLGPVSSKQSGPELKETQYGQVGFKVEATPIGPRAARAAIWVAVNSVGSLRTPTLIRHERREGPC